VPLAAIVLMPFLAERLENWLPKRPAGKPWIPYAVVAIPMFLAVPTVGLDTDKYPAELLSALSSEDRIWNDHRYGGWLGYHDFEVFWDGRNDCYPLEIFDQGVAVSNAEPGYLDVLELWEVDTVVTSRPDLVKGLAALGWTARVEVGDLSVLDRPPSGP
jgi:hypothetical protein